MIELLRQVILILIASIQPTSEVIHPIPEEITQEEKQVKEVERREMGETTDNIDDGWEVYTPEYRVFIGGSDNKYELH